MQIIKYVCIWLLSREVPGAEAKDLLAAKTIDAVVLAPHGYYMGYKLKGVETRLNAELQQLGKTHGVDLSFRYEAFFDSLAAAPIADASIERLLQTRRRILA